MEVCYEPFKKAVQSCGTELEETPTDSGGCLLWAVWSGRGSRWSFIQTNRSYLTIAGLHWHRALQMPWCVFKQEQTWRGARRVSALVTFSNQRCQTTQGGQVFCWICYTQAGKNYSGMWWLMSVSAAETTNESFHAEGKWQKTDLGFRTADFGLFRVEELSWQEKVPRRHQRSVRTNSSMLHKGLHNVQNEQAWQKLV